MVEITEWGMDNMDKEQEAVVKTLSNEEPQQAAEQTKSINPMERVSAPKMPLNLQIFAHAKEESEQNS